MIVVDLKDSNCLDSRPIQAAVRLFGRRIKSRLKDKPLSIRQAQCELTVSPTVELVATAWKVAYFLEGAGCFEIREPASDLLCAGLPVGTLERAMRLAGGL